MPTRPSACARRASPTASRCCSTDYRDLHRQLRQARLDRDDRGGRLAVLPDASSTKCAALTRPGGLFFLQAIVIDDEAYEAREGLAQLRQHPRLPRRLPAVGGADRRARRRQLDARSRASRTSPPSYARTLELWRERFNDARPAAAPARLRRALRRLWNFYLAFSEAGFRERRIRDLQIVLAKPGRRPRIGTEPMAIAYSRAGSGEPLVLIHGLGGSRRIWEPVHRPARRRARRDRRRHARLRRVGRAGRTGSRPTPANLGAAVAELCARARARALPPGRQLARRLGGARARQGRVGAAASARSRRPGCGGGRSAHAGSTRTRSRTGSVRCSRLLLASPRDASRGSCARRWHIRSCSTAEEARGLIDDWLDAPGYDAANARDARPRLRATRSWSRCRRRSPGARATAWSVRRGASGCRPARATSSSPGVGHTPTWDDPELVAKLLLDASGRIRPPRRAPPRPARRPSRCRSAPREVVGEPTRDREDRALRGQRDQDRKLISRSSASRAPGRRHAPDQRETSARSPAIRPLRC